MVAYRALRLAQLDYMAIACLKNTKRMVPEEQHLRFTYGPHMAVYIPLPTWSHTSSDHKDILKRI